MGKYTFFVLIRKHTGAPVYVSTDSDDANAHKCWHDEKPLAPKQERLVYQVIEVTSVDGGSE